MTRKYKFLRGMTLPVLEAAINRAITQDPSSRLVQAFFAQGTGFVAAMEYQDEEKQQPQPAKQPPAADPSAKQPPAASKAPAKSSKS